MKLSPDELRARLSALNWTSHNIRLAGEVTTLPGRAPFDSDERLRAIVGTLEALYGPDLSGLKIADLASLEGGYALALARRGAAVVGVEARASNFAKLELIREHFGLPDLEFRRADVKGFRREEYGEFDVVLALGILYHLDRPASWLRMIAPAIRRVLILDTHYAPESDEDAARLDPSIGILGPREEEEGDPARSIGRWSPEVPPGTDPESQPWASYSNARSFWLTRESLLRALRAAGFDLLFEQHDVWLEHYRLLQAECPRGLFVAIKTSPAGRDR